MGLAGWARIWSEQYRLCGALASASFMLPAKKAGGRTIQKAEGP